MLYSLYIQLLIYFINTLMRGKPLKNENTMYFNRNGPFYEEKKESEILYV